MGLRSLFLRGRGVNRFVRFQEQQPGVLWDAERQEHYAQTPDGRVAVKPGDWLGLNGADEIVVVAIGRASGRPRIPEISPPVLSAWAPEFRKGPREVRMAHLANHPHLTMESPERTFVEQIRAKHPDQRITPGDVKAFLESLRNKKD